MGLIDRFKKKKMAEDLQKKAVVKDAFVPSSLRGDSVEPGRGEKKEVKKEEPKEKIAVKKTDKQLKGNAYQILLQPIVSEKCAIAESHGKYTFAVAKSVNKLEIKKAVKQVYGIMPKKIRIINVEGKKARYGRYSGRRSDWKKAIVTLPVGQSIDIHEGV